MTSYMAAIITVGFSLVTPSHVEPWHMPLSSRKRKVDVKQVVGHKNLPKYISIPFGTEVGPALP